MKDGIIFIIHWIALIAFSGFMLTAIENGTFPAAEIIISGLIYGATAIAMCRGEKDA